MRSPFGSDVEGAFFVRVRGPEFAMAMEFPSGRIQRNGSLLTTPRPLDRNQATGLFGGERCNLTRSSNHRVGLGIAVAPVEAHGSVRVPKLEPGEANGTIDIHAKVGIHANWSPTETRRPRRKSAVVIRRFPSGWSERIVTAAVPQETTS